MYFRNTIIINSHAFSTIVMKKKRNGVLTLLCFLNMILGGWGSIEVSIYQVFWSYSTMLFDVFGQFFVFFNGSFWLFGLWGGEKT